jgi:hypothetical protein
MVSKCAICGITNNILLEKHHIIPRSRGGTNTPGNEVYLCRNCHKLVHKGLYKPTMIFNDKERRVMLAIFNGYSGIEPLKEYTTIKRDCTLFKTMHSLVVKLLRDESIKSLLKLTVFSRCDDIDKMKKKVEDK